MTTITFLIQTAERMIRDTKTPMGELCATWNRLNFEANTGLSFSTPTRRSKLIERLEAAIIELNSRDSRMSWDGKDNREFSGNSIAAAHDEAFKMDRERTANLLAGMAQRIVDGHDSRITNHNDLCDLAKAPQHLYAGEELDLTVEFNRKEFERKQQQLTDFINKETPRYFAADFVYKVSESGFVTVWNNVHREWREINLSIVNLINMGAAEVTEADVNAYTTINNGRAVYSTDKGRHFVQVDGKHLYEFASDFDAVSYANRINGVQS